MFLSAVRSLSPFGVCWNTKHDSNKLTEMVTVNVVGFEKFSPQTHLKIINDHQCFWQTSFRYPFVTSVVTYQ